MKLTAEQWQRYMDNTCNEQERKAIFDYLNGLEPDDLEILLETGFPEQAATMPPLLAKRLDQKLEAVTGIRLTPAQHRVRWKMAYRWVAAASIVLLIGLAWYHFSPVPWPAKQQQAQVNNIRAISNTTTHVQKLTLPDGSHVWLSPQSTLQVPDNFSDRNRTLHLIGQGYFEIRSLPLTPSGVGETKGKMPFIVNTAGLQVSVLGTHFNIEAYAGELNSTVSLTEGKVAVRAHTASGADSLIYLQPGNKLVYQNLEKKWMLQPVDVEYEKSWKTGSLVFDDLPVNDVLLRLEHRFGKKIQFDAHQFTGKKFRAVYPYPDLQLVLRDMSFVQGFRYRQKEDSILIEPQAETK
jgi:transmembrane sensor